MNTERKVNRVVSVERRNNDVFGWHLYTTYQDGGNTLFGKTHMTDRGSKRELTITAKRFGLVKDGDVATLA